MAFAQVLALSGAGGEASGGSRGRKGWDDHLNLGEWSCRPCPSPLKWQMGIMVPERNWEEGAAQCGICRRTPPPPLPQHNPLLISLSHPQIWFWESPFQSSPSWAPPRVLRGEAVLGVWERHRPLKPTRALVHFVCHSLGGSVAPPTFLFWILSLVAGREDYPDCATGIL